MLMTTLAAVVSMAIAQVGGYKDVPTGHWASNSIANLVSMKMLPVGGGREFQGDKPVTRYEFAVIMDRFIQDIRRAFLRQPEEKTINEAKIKGRTDDGSKVAMVRLAKGGFLPYYSPIFHGPSDTLTPEMLSIAMSQIAQRIAWCFRQKDDDGYDK